jgi:hypothetical protein
LPGGGAVEGQHEIAPIVTNRHLHEIWFLLVGIHIELTALYSESTGHFEARNLIPFFCASQAFDVITGEYFCEPPFPHLRHGALSHGDIDLISGHTQSIAQCF